MTIEYRSQDNPTLEIREDGDGTFEGYFVVWDTVDSYNSTFQRGAFAKTLKERGHKVKLLWNHDMREVIGVPEELREDDHGVFVRGKLITTIQKGAEVHELMKAGAINTLSFGFRTVKEKFVKGVRVITEVMLAEVSPVVFEANENAEITSVRAQDFNDTAMRRELFMKRRLLLISLEETLEDIWWESVGNEAYEDSAAKFDKAAQDFAAAHAEWFNQYAAFMSDGEARSEDFSLLTDNPLTEAVVKYMREEELTVDSMAQRTSLTVEEVRALRAGKSIAAHDKLSDLGEDIRQAHQQIRSRAVETLCSELRAGINSAEAKRILNLVNDSLPEETRGADMSDAVGFLDSFRSTLEINTQE